MCTELDQILLLVKRSKPTGPSDVQKVVDDYFRPIGFSLLKQEYEVSMTSAEKFRFIEKLYTDTMK